MPVYEYRCNSCQNRFEQRRGFSHADDPTQCPACRGEEVTRQLSTFVAFSKGGSGESRSVTGSSCASCSAGSCAGCGQR